MRLRRAKSDLGATYSPDTMETALLIHCVVERRNTWDKAAITSKRRLTGTLEFNFANEERW